ncbi:Early nodulin-like protein [Drosera capensis]
MASSSSTVHVTLFALAFLLSVHNLFPLASAFEFQVGDLKGWSMPPKNDTGFYNEWASRNRFCPGDTIRFSYRKDSVMEVREEEYKKCNATQPLYFSNTGNTLIELNRSGSFYFISGSSGHCQRGQRMIIVVLSPEDGPGGDTHGKSTSGAVAVAVAAAAAPALVLLGQFVMMSLDSMF